MKKILALLLALCTCFSLAVGLSSCREEHVHEYSAFWTFDEEYHWHDCIGNCGSSIDKAPHVWGEGTITQEADEETTGLRLYVCKLCGKERVEKFDFDPSNGPTTTVREDQMKRAFDRDRFHNVTMTFYSTDSGEFASEAVYLITEEGLYRYRLDEDGVKFDERYYLATGSGYDVYTKDENAIWKMESISKQRFSANADYVGRFVDQYAVFSDNYGKFEYNENDKEYQLFSDTIAKNNISYAVMRFEAKRLTFLGFLCPVSNSLDYSTDFYGNYQEFRFENYGTTSFTLPSDIVR